MTFSTNTTGRSGSLRYLYSFGDGTYLNWTNRSVVTHAYGAAGGFCASVAVEGAGSLVHGGASNRVNETIGNGKSAACTPWVPLVAHLASNGTRADLPGDFPLNLTTSGGAGPLTVHYRSDDPYVSACQCGMFRVAGNHTITVYVNDSLNQETVSTLNVTVYPSLNGSFIASRQSGRAPLSIDFTALLSGGHSPNASATQWQFGDGMTAQGADVNHTYINAGLFVAVAHVEDRGRGNASEAFLIDVEPAVGSTGAILTAHVTPVYGAGAGGLLTGDANVTGGVGPYLIRWSFSSNASSFGSRVNQSLPETGCVVEGSCQWYVNISAVNASGDPDQCEPSVKRGDLGSCHRPTS